jgi:hypothetical protein
MLAALQLPELSTGYLLRPEGIVTLVLEPGTEPVDQLPAVFQFVLVLPVQVAFASGLFIVDGRPFPANTVYWIAKKRVTRVRHF